MRNDEPIGVMVEAYGRGAIPPRMEEDVTEPLLFSGNRDASCAREEPVHLRLVENTQVVDRRADP